MWIILFLKLIYPLNCGLFRLPRNTQVDTHSAKQVASTMDCDEARAHYERLGEMLQSCGFNFDCAPCIDLDDDPGCPVIGGIDRSYSDNPSTVVEYATAMIEALRAHNVVSSIKHFPGHGRAPGDTHEGLVDITDTWNDLELEPYRALIEQNMADSVMSAHLIHRDVDA